MASTAMRRRVLECATLGEWDRVREAVDVQGCSLNIQEEETGLSLVHWAAQQGNVETLAWLIERGAFLRLKDKRGISPLKGATMQAQDLLLQHAYSAAERIAYARGGATLEVLEQELGSADAAALNEPLWDEDGATLAAFLASHHGSKGFDAVPLLRWLASKGADLEATDDESCALLHQVDWSFGAAVAEPLLTWALREAGLQHVDLRNSDGETPPLLCAYASPSGGDALRCLRLFEAAGANLALGNKKGMNVPMTLARYHGDGPWLGWCFSQAGVDAGTLCIRKRTAADYLLLHGTEESDEEEAQGGADIAAEGKL